jgi:hypothetical protein
VHVWKLNLNIATVQDSIGMFCCKCIVLYKGIISGYRCERSLFPFFQTNISLNYAGIVQNVNFRPVGASQGCKTGWKLNIEWYFSVQDFETWGLGWHWWLGICLCMCETPPSLVRTVSPNNCSTLTNISPPSSCTGSIQISHIDLLYIHFLSFIFGTLRTNQVFVRLNFRKTIS